MHVSKNFSVLMGLAGLMALSACAFSDPNASGYRRLQHEQCVPYARAQSGINLRGNANTWWDQAESRYARGSRPQPGAILVLGQSARLPQGHLAVVREVLAPRDITVTHTNWGNDWASRRIVYQSMRAQDVSPDNSWTAIRFWNRETGLFGAAYPASGFIYNAGISQAQVTPAYSMPIGNFQ